MRNPGALESIANAIAKASENEIAADRKTWLEIAKNALDLKSTSTDIRYKRWAAFAPYIAVIFTAVALMAQVWQFRVSSAFQADQFRASSQAQAAQLKTSSQVQADQSEDASWRELLKSVSFRGGDSALVSALAMQGFFGSPRYGLQARSIATALLPKVTNVAGFDEVFDDMVRKTNSDNFKDLRSVSAMISFSERYDYKIEGPTLSPESKIPPFLEHDVTSIDLSPHVPLEKTIRDRIAAWELDTCSQGMRRRWQRKEPVISPMHTELAAVVLENSHALDRIPDTDKASAFQNLDFTGANLSMAVLYDADFSGSNFSSATLTNTSFREVHLEGANFSGITRYEGSTWTETD